MDDTTPDLMQQFFHVFTLLHRYQAYRFRAFGPMGNPHRGQGRVLSILKRRPQISQKELSELMEMRNQSLGELLAKLERSGYITRTPSEEDRRVLNIRLTGAGASAADRSGPQSVEPESVFDVLSAEEQAQLGLYLGRLSEALETRMEEAGFAEPFRGNFGDACHWPPEGRGGYAERGRHPVLGHGEPPERFGKDGPRQDRPGRE